MCSTADRQHEQSIILVCSSLRRQAACCYSVSYTRDGCPLAITAGATLPTSDTPRGRIESDTHTYSRRKREKSTQDLYATEMMGKQGAAITRRSHQNTKTTTNTAATCFSVVHAPYELRTQLLLLHEQTSDWLDRVVTWGTPRLGLTWWRYEGS